jgi:hypothetical protein
MSGISTTEHNHFILKPLLPNHPRLRFVEGAPDGGTDGGDDKGAKPDADKGKKEFEPITSQDDLDRVIGQRVAREREKTKDYDELKKAADELKELKEKQKTADEKALDAAREEGRSQVRGELHQERALTALDKALAGRALNTHSALIGLDPKQFLNSEGRVDDEAIKNWVAANTTEAKKLQEKDDAQGKRGESTGSVQGGRDLYAERHPSKSK